MSKCSLLSALSYTHKHVHVYITPHDPQCLWSPFQTLVLYQRPVTWSIPNWKELSNVVPGIHWSLSPSPWVITRRQRGLCDLGFLKPLYFLFEPLVFLKFPMFLLDLLSLRSSTSDITTISSLLAVLQHCIHCALLVNANSNF